MKMMWKVTNQGIHSCRVISESLRHVRFPCIDNYGRERIMQEDKDSPHHHWFNNKTDAEIFYSEWTGRDYKAS